MTLVPYQVGKHVFNELYEKHRNIDINGMSVKICQSFDVNGVAGCVWHSSIVLSRYFSENRSLIASKNVIELGAGTGLLGIICHRLGANVLSTDHTDFVESTRTNFRLNDIDPEVHCRAFNWGSDISVLENFV